MRNPILNALSAAMDNVLSEVTAAVCDIHAQANEQRKKLLAILTAMHDTQVTLDEVSAICAEAAEVLSDAADTCDSLNAKVTDAIEDPIDACPKCNFEDLLGFCEHCGAEVTEDNLGTTDECDLYCTDCAPEDEEEESEDDYNEPAVEELAESVEPVEA